MRQRKKESLIKQCVIQPSPPKAIQMPHSVDLLRKDSNDDFLPIHPHVTVNLFTARKPTDRWHCKYQVPSRHCFFHAKVK